MLGGMSKNEEIQFFGSQIYFPVIRLYHKSKSFCKHGGICRFDKKIQEIFVREKTLRAHRNMRGCILEVDSEGIGW